MVINIPTDKELIYKQYLTILNSVLVDSKLSPLEIDVLTAILTINSMYQHKGIDTANKITFHPKTKIRIREKIAEDLKVGSFSEQSFNNIMLKLRTKKFITTNTVLYKVPLEVNGIQMVFNLILDAGTNTRSNTEESTTE